MDNCYNSLSLSQKLLDLKTHSNGTLRSNRKGNPQGIYLSKWVDKRPVLMITTLNHPEMVNGTNRHGQSSKPLEVATYNKFMSGIDRCDQMVSYYSSPSKTVRWYKKVIFHLLDLAVWNCFYIYKKYVKRHSKSYGFINFREE
ncbi:hypothetical protein ABMA28_009429 [Loxostege sticticalis]|uniref:PiggyBac transposable element-derived protein domain-containing protein n=1 Tax=Loxostege sticticalis TaxID=481309 RepID=A0ABD0SD95_LOXSC